MAPQLRRSLEMLQIPVMELRTMIQTELEQNPTIEEVPIAGETIEIEPGAADIRHEDTAELSFDKEFEALASLDAEWRDYFFQNLHTQTYTAEDDEKRQFFMDSLSQTQSLQEHLMGQLHLAGLSDQQRLIGEMVVGSINDDGYLTSTPEELAQSSGSDVAQIHDMLVLIQDFHPTGVGARDLRECLLLQLERIGRKDTVEARIVDQHLEALGRHRLADIARSLKTTLEAVQAAAHFIATLEPKPGRAFAPEVATYIYPEIEVRKMDGAFIVIMNDDQLPHVRISRQYRALLENKDTRPEVKTYVRERIRSGAFMIKSIHQRQKTIYRIASEIVARQPGFLDHGVSHLKPLTMAQIAQAVSVHETTVSRAVSGKYMRTPVGTFELKYFFAPGITTSDGVDISNKTVKDKIASLVAAEDTAQPLSDHDIMDRLKQQGIQIARRTVSKYRIALRLAPSHLRKAY